MPWLQCTAALAPPTSTFTASRQCAHVELHRIVPECQEQWLLSYWQASRSGQLQGLPGCSLWIDLIAY
uniref:Putative secreted protein n=1 Tax=Ixodes ricinus TaxID=34613 RepID=A0A6B0TSZ8_IXORI